MKLTKNIARFSSRIHADPFNAMVSQIAFLVHRQSALNWQIKDHTNPNFDILGFTLSGRASYECNGEEFDVERGSMLFFPRGVPHSSCSDPKDPWSFFSVGFRLEPDIPQTQQAFNKLPYHQPMTNFTHINDLFHQFNRLWRTDEPGFSMACRGLTLMLMQQYVANVQRKSHRVPHALEIEAIVSQMHANIGSITSVAELAQQADLSDSRFRVLFRQLTGCSVTRYQNRLRIQAAQDLLISGQYSVGEVADELGFRDVYYFSRLFKRITGMTPSACRFRQVDKRIVQQNVT